MIYEFRGPGAPQGIPAPVVGAELQRIYREEGSITAASVVDAARAPDAVLHTAFEWQDDLAADRYRESQARALVRAIVLVPEPEKGEVAPLIRAFVSLSAPDSPRTRFYKPMLEALSDPVEAEEVKTRLRHELLNLRRRYMDLLEVTEIMQVAQAVLVA